LNFNINEMFRLCFGWDCFSMATYNVELNHKEIKVGQYAGLHSVLVRVTADRKHQRHHTGVYVRPNQFNKPAKYGRWIKNMPVLNAKIEAKIDELKRMQGEQVEKKKINSFFVYAYDFIEKYNNDQSRGTYKMYLTKLRRLEQYTKGFLNFEMITVEFIRKYTVYLTNQKLNNKNTIAGDLRKIKAIINQALKEDIITKNPFVKIKIETERTVKERLTVDELKRLITFPLAGSRMIESRDIFLFSIYTMGTRVGDLLRLKVGDISNNVLQYQMSKTKKVKFIELVPAAQRIYLQYSQGKQPDEYLFPFMDRVKKGSGYDMTNKANSVIGTNLRAIGKLIGLKKPLSMHIARHTFAQLAYDSGIDLRTAQAMLDHSKFDTTEGYMNDFSHSQINRANREILKGLAFPDRR
jgi:integrase/recombinase XerD